MLYVHNIDACVVLIGPLPVLPEVGSIIVSPVLRRPFFSASSTMRRPMRSLTLPPALKNSHLTTVETAASKLISSPTLTQTAHLRISHLTPSAFPILLSLTRGVLPML